MCILVPTPFQDPILTLRAFAIFFLLNIRNSKMWRCDALGGISYWISWKRSFKNVGSKVSSQICGNILGRNVRNSLSIDMVSYPRKAETNEHLAKSDTEVSSVPNAQWRIRGSTPGNARRYSLIQSIQTGSGSNPAPYSMGTGGPLRQSYATGQVLLLLLSVGLPVANAPYVLQPCGLLYYPWCSNSHHQSSPQEILAVRGGAKLYYF